MEAMLISKKLEDIERELNLLRNMIMEKPKKNVSLKGLFRGIKVTDKEIEEAKKSIFHLS